MSEENGARMRAESRVVEVEKQCSMLEFDLKQSVQKMEQLMKQKERLEDEVRDPFHLALHSITVPCICDFLPLLCFPSPGEESADTGRTGVEQACPGSE